VCALKFPKLVNPHQRLISHVEKLIILMNRIKNFMHSILANLLILSLL